MTDIFDSLPGTRLEPGSIVIPSEERAQLASVLGSAPPTDGTLHPLYAYIAAQRGIGIRIPELCALADFDIDDGPMLGSIDLEIHRPILPDTRYRVEGEVVGIVRKRGRSAGIFDLMTFRETLIDGEGAVVSTSTSTFVLPRRESTS